MAASNSFVLLRGNVIVTKTPTPYCFFQFFCVVTPFPPVWEGGLGRINFQFFCVVTWYIALNLLNCSMFSFQFFCVVTPLCPMVYLLHLWYSSNSFVLLLFTRPCLVRLRFTSLIVSSNSFVLLLEPVYYNWPSHISNLPILLCCYCSIGETHGRTQTRPFQFFCVVTQRL